MLSRLGSNALKATIYVGARLAVAASTIVTCAGFAGRSVLGAAKFLNYAKREQSMPVIKRVMTPLGRGLGGMFGGGTLGFTLITRSAAMWEVCFSGKAKKKPEPSEVPQTVRWQAASYGVMFVCFLQGSFVTGINTFTGAMTEYDLIHPNTPDSDYSKLGFASAVVLVSTGIWMIFNLRLNALPNVNKAMAFIEQRRNPQNLLDEQELQAHKDKYALHTGLTVFTSLFALPNIAAAGVLADFGTSIGLQRIPLLKSIPSDYAFGICKANGCIGAITCVALFVPSLYRLFQEKFVNESNPKRLKNGMGYALLYGVGALTALLDASGSSIFYEVSGDNVFPEFLSNFGVHSNPYSPGIIILSSIVSGSSLLLSYAFYLENLKRICHEEIKAKPAELPPPPPPPVVDSRERITIRVEDPRVTIRVDHAAQIGNINGESEPLRQRLIDERDYQALAQQDIHAEEKKAGPQSPSRTTSTAVLKRFENLSPLSHEDLENGDFTYQNLEDGSSSSSSERERSESGTPVSERSASASPPRISGGHVRHAEAKGRVSQTRATMYSAHKGIRVPAPSKANPSSPLIITVSGQPEIVAPGGPGYDSGRGLGLSPAQNAS